MAELEKRFGRMVAAHRRLRGLTQEGLATSADISIDLVSKIEGGASGARFPNIQKIAAALGVDPAELFTPERNFGQLRGGVYRELLTELASLDDQQLIRVQAVVRAMLG